MAQATRHIDGLNELRRALRAYSRDAGREFDREAKAIAEKVAVRARGLTPKVTGETAASIKTSSTYKGIAVRSGKPWANLIEYGGRVWLRRGLPYRRAQGAAGGFMTGRNLEVRRVDVGGGRVQNEARYLIRRHRMLNTAANEYGPMLVRQAEQMLGRLAEKHGLD